MNKQATLESEDKLILGFAAVGIGASVWGIVWLISLASVAISGSSYIVR